MRDEGHTGATLDRPGLRAALESIAEGVGDVLMVSGLDRATRSIGDLVALLAWFEQIDRGAFVTLDAMVDTTSITGRLIAHMLAVLGELERSVIADRTRQALIAARAQSRPISRPTISDNADLAELISGCVATACRTGTSPRVFTTLTSRVHEEGPCGGPARSSERSPVPRRPKVHASVPLPDPSVSRRRQAGCGR